MKISLARSSGFCFGVKRALQIALKTAESCNKVYMLGDIVHNEDVVSTIKKAGIKKIKKLTRGKNRTLLIRAHGVGRETFAKARNLGYEIVDATCPMVKEIHKIAQRAEIKGYKIIVIGDKKHDEVQAISGQLKNKAIVIDSPNHIPFKRIKRIKKAVVVAQSTQNIDTVSKIINILNKDIEQLRFFNTICRPTRKKQEEIKRMPLANELMIIIGSRTSANTRRLYEISKSLNKRSYWVQSKKDLKRGWFKAVKTVGVAAGASTPDSTTKEAVNQIRKISLREFCYK